MPTIEIASLHAAALDLDQSDFSVAVMEENRLVSHRSLFYDFLKMQEGVIVHVGNPNFREDKTGGYYAGGLINWNFDDPAFQERKDRLKSNAKNSYANQDFHFQFRPEYKKDLAELLRIALQQSPDRTAFFLTDYQFGPEKADYRSCENLESFWAQHDAGGLQFNTLYKIRQS